MLTHHNTKISISFLGFRDGTTLQYVFFMFRSSSNRISNSFPTWIKKLSLMQEKESNHNTGQGFEKRRKKNEFVWAFFESIFLCFEDSKDRQKSRVF